MTDSASLLRYSKDESTGIKACVPQCVALAQTTLEVSEIARLCTRYQISLTPWGAGTGKSGGAITADGGIILSLELMNKIISVDECNLTAKIEPGVVLADFQLAVEKLGLFYPPDPASAQWCTIGGNVAENAGGPSALKYGVTSDYILTLEIVLMSGEIIKCGKETAKGVTGYDLVSLLCGSEGTLAIITAITVALLVKPRFVATVLVTCASEKAAAQSVANILRQGLVPRALEYIDRISLAAAPNWLGASDGARAALIIECDGPNEDVLLQEMQEIIAIVEIEGATYSQVATDEVKRRQLWDMRKGLSAAIRKLRAYKTSEDICVPLSAIPHMVEFVAELGLKYDWITCCFGHAGDGNLHVQILYDEEDQLRLDGILRELFTETVRLGGTLSGEHGIGLAKKDFMHIEQSPSLINLQKNIKRSFDPSGLLNPGKIWN